MIIPAVLVRKVSPWMINTAEITGPLGKTTLIGILVFFLYGPVGIGKSDHNGFTYLIGPWVFPNLIALLWSLRLRKLPFRIFRGSPFAKHKFANGSDDPAVMRLVLLSTSTEARRHVWFEALKLSSILFAILGSAALIFRNSLNWTLPSIQNHFLSARRVGEPGSWFWLSIIGCPIFTFLIVASDHTRWCLVTWAKRERSRSSA